jgi:glycosyltransferase involved in cell wall biosynthesis
LSRAARVAVVYKSLPHWRARFFELLRSRLAREGVEFVLIYGQPGSADAKKKDRVDLAWGHRIENRIWRVGGVELYWQPCLGHLRNVDLVIVEQANKLLVNFALLLLRLVKRRRVAFWGHGIDFQAKSRFQLRHVLKRLLVTRADWWFTYNETVSRIVRGLGYPAARITDVQNAIDTRELRRLRTDMAPAELDRVRATLGARSENTCIFAGSMYGEKRLRFLLEACLLVRAEIPDFEMIFVGSGEDAGLVAEAARQHDWIHAVGPRFDRDLASHFMVSKLLLMPGLVGLVVLDSFALEVPLVTTAVTYHSPEIEYLEHGVNGWRVEDPDDVQAYASAVVRLLRDDALRARLVEGCRVAAEKYTVENMVERFAVGVMSALESPR